jgi:hypothetical protein
MSKLRFKFKLIIQQFVAKIVQVSQYFPTIGCHTILGLD